MTINGVETIEALIRANVTAAVVIVLVLLLRTPLRRRYGPEVAYALWIAPVVAALASLAPARRVAEAVRVSPIQVLIGDPVHAFLEAGAAPVLVAAWLVGMTAAAGWLAWGQWRFLRRARLGLEGPALVGVVAPRLVVPHDYEQRFSAEERAIVRAHERVHMTRGDTYVNVAVAVIQNLCWFNPLVHLAASRLRQDQELACDAVVVGARPGIRRLYAETLLKTQTAPAPLPLGCRWPATGAHPLEERIACLGEGAPPARRYVAGALAITVLCLGAGLSAWMAKPAHFAPPVVQAPPRPALPGMLFLIYRSELP
jgi:beta-lactamase regulating signal transducer with metallopeptidase domain